MEIVSVIKDLVVVYNGFLTSVLNGNEFAIGLVMTATLGTLTYVLRTVPRYISGQLQKHLTTVLTVDSTHYVYFTLMKELNKHGLVSNSRAIKFDSGYSGWDSEINNKTLSYGTQFFMLRKRPVLISLTRTETNNKIVDTVTITIAGRSHKFFDGILSDITEAVEKINKKDTGYYTFSDKHPIYSNNQPFRTLDSVYIPSKDKTYLTTKLDKFKSDRDYYLDNGIPYHLGILLHGEPGTGKTSLIKAIAAYLKRSILIVDNVTDFITASSMSNVSNYLIVFEEIDTASLSNRNKVNDEEDFDGLSSTYGKVMLGSMLNSMDGLLSVPDRITIMTTNDRSSLDKAMLRRGRIDIEVYVTYMTIESLGNMLTSFIKKDYTYLPRIRYIKNNVVPTEVQNDILDGMSVVDILDKYTLEIHDYKNTTVTAGNILSELDAKIITDFVSSTLPEVYDSVNKECRE